MSAQQFQVRLGKNTTVPLTLGFTKSNELFVGRLAMLGFASACVGEVISGKGYAIHPSLLPDCPFAYSIVVSSHRYCADFVLVTDGT